MSYVTPFGGVKAIKKLFQLWADFGLVKLLLVQTRKRALVNASSISRLGTGFRTQVTNLSKTENFAAHTILVSLVGAKSDPLRTKVGVIVNLVSGEIQNILMTWA